MRLRAGLSGLFIIIVGVMLAAPSSAYLLDERFGVSLALDTDNTHEDSYREVPTIPMDSSSFAPTNHTDTVDYIVDDWHGSWDDTQVLEKSDLGPTGQIPSGGEPYDVEALYFDDDPNHLYFAVVTSFDPPPGRYETRSGVYQTIVSGDLAIDLGINSPYTDGFSYDYGVNLNHENRQGEGENATGGGTTIGTELYKTANADWYLGSPEFAEPGLGELTNFDPDYAGFSGTFIADVTTNYYEYDFGTDQETLYETYVIEVTVPRSQLPALIPGDAVDMSWVMGCRNDVTGENGIIRFEDPPDVDHTPEPGTLALVAIGLMALEALRRRRD